MNDATVSSALLDAWRDEFARVRGLLEVGGASPEDEWFWGMRGEILRYLLRRYDPGRELPEAVAPEVAAAAPVRFAHLPGVLAEKKRGILGELRDWNRERYQHVAFGADAALAEFKRKLIEYERNVRRRHEPWGGWRGVGGRTAERETPRPVPLDDENRKALDQLALFWIGVESKSPELAAEERGLLEELERELARARMGKPGVEPMSEDEILDALSEPDRPAS